MKTRLFLSLGITLLVMGCSSETEEQTNTTKVTKIYVGAEEANANSRTVTDATTNAVTWAEGDEIAVFHINGSGRDDYKHFVLESGAGNASAYFRGVTDEDYLIPGDTYKVVYPYSSVGTYDGENDVLEMAPDISGNNSTSHLANYNWLISQQRTIPTDGTMPSFSLAQTTAIAKIEVDIENFTITGLTNRRYLSNVNFTVNDATQVFYNSIFWDNNLNINAYDWSEVASARFSSNAVQIVNNSSYIYWVPIIQDSAQGIKGLTLSVLWTTSSGTAYSASCNYTPKSMFNSGYIYNVHLKLSFNPDSGNSGTLTIIE